MSFGYVRIILSRVSALSSPCRFPSMTIQTLLTTALGISKPVVQGGMMWVGLAEMASAVSNAGGLGILV